MNLKIEQLGRTPHLPTRVASLISREIIEGRLKPGDRLPTEQMLAASFGVGRNVVREAIARLRSDGLVEARQGVGAFVIGPNAPVLRIDRESLRDPVEFRELLELRAILEIEAAGLAAERHDAGQLDAVRSAMERMRRAESWGEDAVDADLAFHRAVAQAAGNSYVKSFVAFLSEHMRESIVASRVDADLEQSRKHTLAEHEAVLNAVTDRQKAKAREAMRRHILNAAKRLGIRM